MAVGRVLKNKQQAISQGVRHFGKRSTSQCCCFSSNHDKEMIASVFFFAAQ
jgi:hypothetical protein